jgi:hypothetical protein
VAGRERDWYRRQNMMKRGRRGGQYNINNRGVGGWMGKMFLKRVTALNVCVSTTTVIISI